MTRFQFLLARYEQLLAKYTGTAIEWISPKEGELLPHSFDLFKEKRSITFHFTASVDTLSVSVKLADVYGSYGDLLKPTEIKASDEGFQIDVDVKGLEDENSYLYSRGYRVLLDIKGKKHIFDFGQAAPKSKERPTDEELREIIQTGRLRGLDNMMANISLSPYFKKSWEKLRKRDWTGELMSLSIDDKTITELEKIYNKADISDLNLSFKDWPTAKKEIEPRLEKYDIEYILSLSEEELHEEAKAKLKVAKELFGDTSWYEEASLFLDKYQILEKKTAPLRKQNTESYLKQLEKQKGKKESSSDELEKKRRQEAIDLLKDIEADENGVYRKTSTLEKPKKRQRFEPKRKNVLEEFPKDAEQRRLAVLNRIQQLEGKGDLDNCQFLASLASLCLQEDFEFGKLIRKEENEYIVTLYLPNPKPEEATKTPFVPVELSILAEFDHDKQSNKNSLEQLLLEKAVASLYGGFNVFGKSHTNGVVDYNILLSGKATFSYKLGDDGIGQGDLEKMLSSLQEEKRRIVRIGTKSTLEGLISDSKISKIQRHRVEGKNGTLFLVPNHSYFLKETPAAGQTTLTIIDTYNDNDGIREQSLAVEDLKKFFQSITIEQLE